MLLLFTTTFRSSTSSLIIWSTWSCYFSLFIPPDDRISGKLLLCLLFGSSWGARLLLSCIRLDLLASKTVSLVHLSDKLIIVGAEHWLGGLRRSHRGWLGDRAWFTLNTGATSLLGLPLLRAIAWCSLLTARSSVVWHSTSSTSTRCIIWHSWLLCGTMWILSIAIMYTSDRMLTLLVSRFHSWSISNTSTFVFGFRL